MPEQGELLPTMILCAGLGTRLRPLSEWLAKPMVPVGDAPAVAHIARRLRAPTRPLVVNVFHRPDDVRAWAEPEGILVAHEPVLLGTAGGIANAAPLLGAGDVLVWNGDILSALDPRELIRAHRTKTNAQATLAVVLRPPGSGNVGLADGGRIVRLRKASVAPETCSADFVGVQVVGEAIRGTLPREGCIVGDVYIPALERGAHLAAHVVDTTFADIGDIASYVAANRAWLGARSSWHAASARIGAAIDGSIIGAGAQVEAPVLRSIVWPSTYVKEPLTDTIATPFGDVPIP